MRTRGSDTVLDVMVIGGGTAGVIAAVQAGRAGSRTLLVEKAGMLGGTMTLSGVCAPGIFFAWGKQVIAGIGWELVSRSLREAGQTLHPDVFDTGKRHDRHHVPVIPSVYAALCDEAVLGAGVELWLHTMVADVTRGDADLWNITLCTKTGLMTRQARVVIDATGDANAAGLAGFALRVPAENQPATLWCHAAGYDMAALDLDAINHAFEHEVRAGRLQYTDASWDTTKADVGRWLRSGGRNATHTHAINARDSQGKTRLEVAARQSFLRFYRFLRTQPGLEALRIESLSPECGVRETVTLEGQQTVTVDDYVSGRLWEDAVCYAFYPVDLHVSTGAGLQMTPLAEGVLPTVPRGALLPAGSRNFLVAGRCLSSDRLANSALRVEAVCMATGQAAGAMAALATQRGTDVAALPMPAIHELLLRHQAVVPTPAGPAGPINNDPLPCGGLKL